jgi:hypothetical protein
MGVTRRRSVAAVSATPNAAAATMAVINFMDEIFSLFRLKNSEENYQMSRRII